MHRGIKIFVIVIVILAAFSGIFLITSKKPTASTNGQIKRTTLPVQKTQIPQTGTQQPNNSQVAKPQQQAVDRKSLEINQWQQCKNKTMATDTTLLWNIQITEPIPEGGTYAKGFLEGDQPFLVHVIIKLGVSNADLIKSKLIAGKMVFARGVCTDIANDGAVVLQAF